MRLMPRWGNRAQVLLLSSGAACAASFAGAVAPECRERVPLDQRIALAERHLNTRYRRLTARLPPDPALWAQMLPLPLRRMAGQVGLKPASARAVRDAAKRVMRRQSHRYHPDSASRRAHEIVKGKWPAHPNRDGSGHTTSAERPHRARKLDPEEEEALRWLMGQGPSDTAAGPMSTGAAEGAAPAGGHEAKFTDLSKRFHKVLESARSDDFNPRRSAARVASVRAERQPGAPWWLVLTPMGFGLEVARMQNDLFLDWLQHVNAMPRRSRSRTGDY